MASKSTSFEHEEVEVKEPPVTFDKAGLSKSFATMVEARQRVVGQIKELERSLKSEDPEEPGLNLQIEYAMSEKDLKSVAVGDHVVLLMDGKNVTIKREILQQAMLEYGVPADDVVALIELASVTKRYSYIQVQKAKNLLKRTSGKTAGEVKSAVAEMKGKARKRGKLVLGSRPILVREKGKR